MAEERKLVSVLFVDIVDSTAHAERNDPEDVRERLQLFFDTFRAQVERFGGVVEKFIGDAAVAVFGAPLAHGDDAERAVRCGIGVLGDVTALDPNGVAAGMQVPGRRQHGGGPRGPGHGPRAWRGARDRRRGQHRGAPADLCAPRPARRRGRDVPSHEANDPLRAAARGRREGQEPAGHRLARGRRGAGARSAGGRVPGQGPRARGARGDVGARGGGTSAASHHDPGATRHREIPARQGVPRRRPGGGRAQRIHRRKYEAAARAILGEALVAVGRLDEGFTHLEQAVVHADELGTPSIRWQHRTVLEKARHATGSDDAAAAAFREAAEVIHAYAATLSAEHAAGFLDAEPVREALNAAG
jgi:Adenylate and Guanylate cyclase catalytic domain